MIDSFDMGSLSTAAHGRARWIWFGQSLIKGFIGPEWWKLNRHHDSCGGWWFKQGPRGILKIMLRDKSYRHKTTQS